MSSSRASRISIPAPNSWLPPGAASRMQKQSASLVRHWMPRDSHSHGHVSFRRRGALFLTTCPLFCADRVRTDVRRCVSVSRASSDMDLIEYGLFAFSSLFVIVDPIAAVPAFLAMTQRDSVAQRLRTARMACCCRRGIS